MFIFNITFHIEEEIRDECLLYLRNEYVPQACQSGILSSPRLLYVHTQHHHDSGDSYSLQFSIGSLSEFEKWERNEGIALQNNIITKFKDKIVGFITILEEIEL